MSDPTTPRPAVDPLTHPSETAAGDPLASVAAEGALPSMSTDNTPVGQAMDATVEGGPIASVTAGMSVIDAAGQEVGRVKEVRMGDPSAATDRGEVDTEANTFLDTIADAVFGENAEIPESARHELTRTGFVEIDGKGWFGHDYVASPTQLASVEGDTLRLSVSKDELIKV